MVNTDAMQVYRGMDVGTAKLPVAERRGIPHHLLDTARRCASRPPWRSSRAGRRAVIADLRARGAAPVLVGGSALYTRAVLDRFEFPGTDDAVRARLEAELAEVGADALHRRLAEVDPEAAARILPDNGRRVVRALEVVEITGRPFTASLPRLEYADPRTVQVGVDIDRPTLDARIEQPRRPRCSRDGFVDEVARLLERGAGRGPHRLAGDRLPRGGGAPRRRADPRRGARAHRDRDPPVRPPPGLVVPQGPAHRLGARTTTPTASSTRSRRSTATGG